MRKHAAAVTSILGLSAVAASILVGQQQAVQALSVGATIEGQQTTPPTDVSAAPSDGATAGPTASASPSTSSPAPTQEPSSGLQDGDYISQAVRYKYGTIQLGVTIDAGAIASIDLIQASTKGRGYDQAPPMLVDAAIKYQGVDFGNLTGATYSTQAFKQALTNALEQAAQK